MEADLAKRIRQTILRIAQRKQRPGTGSSTDLLQRRSVERVWPDLTPILSPIPWAVVGAVATRLYMPERMTQDLDIVVRAVDGPEARQKLLAAGLTYRGEFRIGQASWITPEGIPIDLIEGREVWWEEAISQAQTNRDAQGLPILPLPYLILMKFQAGRVQDLADVTRMLGQADAETLDTIRALFKIYAPEGLEDLESLIELGQLEQETPQRP